jgi:hypothetical protein
MPYLRIFPSFVTAEKRESSTFIGTGFNVQGRDPEGNMTVLSLGYSTLK